MTDEQRIHANEQLRLDLRKAVADLTHCRREARTLGELFAALGHQLVNEPECMTATAIRGVPTADSLGTLVAELVRLNEYVGQLRQDMRACGLAE